jgi:hypothetical protein
MVESREFAHLLAPAVPAWRRLEFAGVMVHFPAIRAIRNV